MKTLRYGRYYRTEYMYGGSWYSKERRIPVGTVRVINNILSYASEVSRVGATRFGKYTVTWKPLEPEKLRNVPDNERVKV